MKGKPLHANCMVDQYLHIESYDLNCGSESHALSQNSEYLHTKQLHISCFILFSKVTFNIKK